MKKHNQIERKNSRRSSTAQGKKPETKRIRVRMPLALKEAVQTAAKRRKLSVSKLVEEGIREACAAGKQPESETPANWEEVTVIDFTGYLDRDCNERIIYKTPDGAFKATKSDDPEVIEDVTREQVARWIHECFIPEEFEKDFRRDLQSKPERGRQLSQLEVVQLDYLYNLYSEKSFNDGMACFAGLAELMAENTAPEVQTLKRMVEAEQELNGIRSKAMAQ